MNCFRGYGKALILLCSIALFLGCSIRIHSGIYHPVGKGETLWRISYTYGVDIQDVAELNNIPDPTTIYIGQEIFIPGAKKLKKVEPYVPPKKKKQVVSSSGKKKKKKTVAKKPVKKKVVLQKGAFSWPVKGAIITKFGMNDGMMHSGIDIKAARGAKVKAAGGGEVVYASDKLQGYGNVIIIKHKGDYFTVYAQNEKNLVVKGRKVKKGETIATVGDSGRAVTPHLHFEIRQGSKTRNPLFFLP